MLQTFFYLKRTQMKIEHSNGTLSLLRGHSKGNRKALGHLGTWAHKGLEHLGTQALEVLVHSEGTWTLKELGHLSTQALWHWGTQGFRGTLFSRLIFSFLTKCTLNVRMSHYHIIKMKELYK